MKKLLLFAILLLAITASQAQEWEELDLGTDANFQDICYALNNESYVFVAGGEEIYKSTNGGDTWTSLSQSIAQTIWGITFPTTLIGYVCSNDGYILKTTDGGQNWSISLQLTSGGFDRIVFKDEDNGIASGSATYTTSDGGDNWTLTNSEGYWALDYAEGDTYFAASQIKIMKTTNNGQSWTMQKQDFNSLFGSVSFYDDTHGLAGDAGKVWISNNGGVSWDEYSSPGFGINRAAARMDFDTCFISGEDGLIYKSTDGGVNWELDADYSGNLLRDMDITPGNTVFAAGFQGIVLRKVYAEPEADPAISVDPTSLVFDSIPVADTTIEMLTVTNSGGKTLRIDSIVSDHSYFWTNQGPFNLGADESKTFEVFFSPAKSGFAEGFLTIYNNTKFTGAKKVHMSGYGLETVGMDETISQQADFLIYPNPASAMVTISFDESIEEIGQLVIRDISGKKCMEMDIKPFDTKDIRLNVSTLKPGLYFVSVQNGKNELTTKLLISK
ncbi:MAG: YCF48-related protein [Bacteroidales bacterium]|nr:YCF48-related protein [Bacteroidales bacterium]